MTKPGTAPLEARVTINESDLDDPSGSPVDHDPGRLPPRDDTSASALAAHADLEAWRTEERRRLIGLRPASASRSRFALNRQIIAHLDEVLGDVSGHMISVYWPFRREPHLLGWMDDVVLRGGRCALPVVVAKAAPLVFRAWRANEPLERGMWNIPVPRDGPEVVPDIVIAPLVGFDPDHYRLGYGGGFYDRTLAGLSRRPRVVGIGYAVAAMATIHPQPHDIAMDTIVTERGIDAF